MKFHRTSTVLTMTTVSYTYTELKAKVSSVLGRELPPSTLSNWMKALGYKRPAFGKRRPKRCWDSEDLNALVDYGYYLSLGYSSTAAKEYAYRRSEVS
jgi:hypothetical protein